MHVPQTHGHSIQTPKGHHPFSKGLENWQATLRWLLSPLWYFFSFLFFFCMADSSVIRKLWPSGATWLCRKCHNGAKWVSAVILLLLFYVPSQVHEIAHQIELWPGSNLTGVEACLLRVNDARSPEYPSLRRCLIKLSLPRPKKISAAATYLLALINNLKMPKREPKRKSWIRGFN